MYWVRFSWDHTLTATMTLKYLGQRFSSDSELTSYYPDLANTNLMASFGAGKVDWIEQAYMAGEMIIRDLMSRKIVVARGQVFDWARFTEASCHKVAEIIYRGCGSAYDDNRKGAADDYKAAMNKDYFRVDINQDGALEPLEKNISQTFMTR